jgi:hypothetical protein
MAIWHAAILGNSKNALWQRWLRQDYRLTNKVTHKNCVQPEFPFGYRAMQQFQDKSLQISRLDFSYDFFSLGGT